MKTEIHRPIPADIGEYMDYDPISGLFTATQKRHPLEIGQTLGTINSQGYIMIGFRREQFCAHRVAWFLHTGEDPSEMTVDHIDGNRTNNRIGNLRLIPNNEQQYNRGALGYTWHKDSQKLHVSLSVLGKRVHGGYYYCPLLARIGYEDLFKRIHPDVPFKFLPRKQIKGRPELTP